MFNAVCSISSVTPPRLESSTRRVFDDPLFHSPGAAYTRRTDCFLWVDVTTREQILGGVFFHPCIITVPRTFARAQVFMISYMVDGQGYLIISREVVSEDIEVSEIRMNSEMRTVSEMRGNGGGVVE